MKKWKLLWITGVMILGCAGCGKQESETMNLVEDISMYEEQEVDEQRENKVSTDEQTESEAEVKNENYSDLEEKGENGELTDFAQQIQEAVAGKDLEALADLCSYPLAVNGEVVENRDAFLALGADTVFTEERCAVIAAVDAQTLEETMAGVIMGDATPNIIFKSVDGKPGITGIN